MCSIIGVGERLHKVLGQIDLGTLDSGERSLPFGLLVFYRTVPGAIACLHRHSAGCKETDMSIMFVKERIHDVLKDHCPQIYCDVCGAQTCIGKLNMNDKGKDFCR